MFQTPAHCSFCTAAREWHSFGPDKAHEKDHPCDKNEPTMNCIANKSDTKNKAIIDLIFDLSFSGERNDPDEDPHEDNLNPTYRWNTRRFYQPVPSISLWYRSSESFPLYTIYEEGDEGNVQDAAERAKTEKSSRHLPSLSTMVDQYGRLKDSSRDHEASWWCSEPCELPLCTIYEDEAEDRIPCLFGQEDTDKIRNFMMHDTNASQPCPTGGVCAGRPMLTAQRASETNQQNKEESESPLVPSRHDETQSQRLHERFFPSLPTPRGPTAPTTDTAVRVTSYLTVTSSRLADRPC